MDKTTKSVSDSPLFIDLIRWLERKNVRRLRTFFPLGRYSTWGRVRHGNKKTFFRTDDLDKLRDYIRTDLVDPLFVRRGLNVRFESDCRRHKKENAYCCVEFYRKRLAKIPATDLKTTLRDFESDFKSATPGAGFPFVWILEGRDPVSKELAELTKQMAQFERDELRLDSTSPIDELMAKSELMEMEKRDLLWANDLAKAADEGKRRYALDRCAQIVATMKWAQGKPGRHPKEFNVLVYHIIKKCTRWKIDWNKRAAGVADPYKRRKDDQHRLETDWKLTVFLLLDLHIHQHKLPEIGHFISCHRKERASVGLRKMQGWLLNIRKNFPAMHGWAMNKEGFSRAETGFRKLIVGEDGRLKVISL
jgi:hypothetical protein